MHQYIWVIIVLSFLLLISSEALADSTHGINTFLLAQSNNNDRSDLEAELFGEPYTPEESNNREALEAELFGSPSPEERDTLVEESSPAEGHQFTDEQDRMGLSESSSISWEKLEDTLEIGGDLYSQITYAVLDETYVFPLGTSFKTMFALFNEIDVNEVDELLTIDQTNFGFSNNLYVYMDSRPNDDLRVFVKGILFFDPTYNQGFFGEEYAEVTADLEELWIKFTLWDYLFFTLGKQKIKWGTGRIWTPTDFLNENYIDPFAVWDARPGVSMIKLHIPVESLGWNFYIMGKMDDIKDVDSMGLAVKAEFVFSTVEIGLMSVLKKNTRTRYGISISAGVWIFDVYAEWAFKYGAIYNKARGQDPFPIELAPGPIPDEEDPISLQGVEFYYPEKKLYNQITAGIEYTFNYSADDLMTLNAEYFYNQEGYNDIEDLSAAIIGNILGSMVALEGMTNPIPFNFRYMGVHYVSLIWMLPTPGSLNHTTFLISSMANLSDKTGLSVLNISHELIDDLHMNFIMYASYSFIDEVDDYRGELRFGNQFFNFILSFNIKI